jgi:hypothetical protein
MRRSGEDRLRLFDTHVSELLSESAGTAEWSVKFDLVAGTAETVEPHREAFRSWLMAVRILDAPREDIYLPAVMDLLEGQPICDETRELVGMIRGHWTNAQTSLGVQMIDGEGTITSREAFELVVYAQHLHRDPIKEARVNAMDPAFWILVRHEGVAYGGVIADLSVFLRSVGREDPATSHLFAPAPPETPSASEI